DLPGLQLPNAWLIGGFLLLYIIIMGPVNFIVLRRLRRTELAWITIPALVVIFSAVAYATALGSKGGEIVAIRANAINTAEGLEQATLAQHFGVYSPRRTTYRFTLDAESTATELNSFGYYQNGPDAPVPVLGGS